MYIYIVTSQCRFQEIEEELQSYDKWSLLWINMIF